MKTLIVTVFLVAAFTSCTSAPQQASANSSSTAAATPTPAITPQVHVTPPPGNTTDNTVSSSETNAAPVDFTYIGTTPDNERIAYRIKVNTARPIKQVDMNFRYFDAQGKLVAVGTRSWQNIVKSTKQAIEQGKTYKVTDDLEPGAIRAEGQLMRVFFADGSTWSAK